MLTGLPELDAMDSVVLYGITNECANDQFNAVVDLPSCPRMPAEVTTSTPTMAHAVDRTGIRC